MNPHSFLFIETPSVRPSYFRAGFGIPGILVFHFISFFHEKFSSGVLTGEVDDEEGSIIDGGNNELDLVSDNEEDDGGATSPNVVVEQSVDSATPEPR